MRASLLCCIGLLSLVRTATGDELPPTTVSVDLVRRHVEILASPEFEGRGTRAGKAKAAEYLVGQFREIGLKPLFGQQFVQDVPGPKSEDGRESFSGHNLGGYLPARDPKFRDEWIILAAHYDHLGVRKGQIYPGADDNAGSVAMMLEVARHLARDARGPRRNVAFVSFDLEEAMLWGSRWFAAHPPMKLERIKLFVTAEMLGHTLGDLPLPVIFVMGAEQANGLRDLVDSVPVPKGLESAYLGVDLVGTRSDYGPFQGEHVPFLFFSGGEHPDYHQPTDTADRMDHDRVARVSDLVLGVIRKAADLESPPEWTNDPQHGLDEIRTIRRITTALLDRDAAAPAESKLTTVQKLLVNNVHARTKQILDRGTIDPSERPWLIRSAQALLLSVF